MEQHRCQDLTDIMTKVDRCCLLDDVRLIMVSTSVKTHHYPRSYIRWHERAEEWMYEARIREVILPTVRVKSIHWYAVHACRIRPVAKMSREDSYNHDVRKQYDVCVAFA